MTTPGASPVLPPSATHPAVAACGFLAWIAAIAFLRLHGPFGSLAASAAFVLACTTLGLLLPDLLWRKTYRSALDKPSPGPGARDRVVTKYLGLVGSLGFIAFLYWLFPEYNTRDDSFYRHYWQFLRYFVPLLLITAPVYLWFVDRRMKEPEDELWHMGLAVTFRPGKTDWNMVGRNLLGWLIKGYFFPLMFAYMCDDLGHFVARSPGSPGGFTGWYDFLFSAAYFLDVSLASMGYLMALRLTDSHIRSPEPTFFGWAVALACYQPFWALISRQYISYESGLAWSAWLADSPVLHALWGGAILLLIFVYAWATVCFGLRFSNLTHRGIITSGPYRFTRHPAYVSKGLSFWLISIPFIANGGMAEALRHSLLLLLLNGIYYLRAKTEERHLMLDPVYRDYAAWTDRHGIFRWMRKVPGLRSLAAWRPVFGKTYASQD